MIKNKLMNQTQESKIVEYESNGQKVKLSPTIIRNYLVNGGGNVSDQEVVMFLNLCKFQKLNPFLREAYLIKYGNQPATLVTGKDAILKRAYRNENYAGNIAGIIVVGENGEIERRTGTFKLPDEDLVGGWAKVFIKGYEQPIENEVSLDEYIGKTKDGEVNSQWQRKPATMIRKVALVQALREAFPEELQAMYDAAEMNLDFELPQNEIAQNNISEAEYAESTVEESNDDFFQKESD